MEKVREYAKLIARRRASGRGNSQCNGPEALRQMLPCLRNNKRAVWLEQSE